MAHVSTSLITNLTIRSLLFQENSLPCSFKNMELIPFLLRK